VPANGLLAISLYAKTPVCSFWEGEKRFYSSAGKRTQGLMRLAYKTAYLAGVTASGKNPIAYVRNVRSARGMSSS
jgi:hypothetical protein